MAHPSLAHLDHRPWPICPRPWVWRQSWYELLFAHYPVPADQVRRLVPPELQVQEFDGTSWVGVVPFRMAGVMRRPLPDLPWVSAFPELNVRVYVQRDGRPGVWFLSLDASNGLAVWAARRFFYLPYYHARMSHEARVSPGGGASVTFHSRRRDGRQPAEFHATYRPISEPAIAKPGTLEHFLAERYCLYARSPAGRLYRADVHHPPWPLQKAEGEVSPSALLATHGLAVDVSRPLLHYSRGVDTVVWNPEPL